MDKLLNPRSVALIGASHDTEKIGYQILRNLLHSKYDGKIFGVNPKGGTILGTKLYPSLIEIKDSVDLAIIAIPSAFVKQSVMECAEKKVKSIIIISAGFSEASKEGQELQDEVVKICRENNISMLGPNCLGMINVETGLNASFAREMPPKGNISIISQSGAMITALIDWSKGKSVGFSKIISMGNKAQITEEDALLSLYNDKTTKVVALYMESLTVSDRLIEILRANTKKKPTIALFGGQTSFGAEAASSHTGSLVSSYIAVETFLKQSGIIVAENLSQFLSLCKIFTFHQTVSGKNSVVITNAGGPSIIACDSLQKSGLGLSKLSAQSTESLSKSCRPCANISNPIDVLGDASEKEYKIALDNVSSDKNVDSILVLLTPQTATKIDETAEVVTRIKTKKPILASFIGGKSLEGAIETMEKHGIPCFESPDEAVFALKCLYKFNFDAVKVYNKREQKLVYQKTDKNELIHKFRLPVIEYLESEIFEDIHSFCDKIGYPVVLKTANKNIIHKSDQGQVFLNIIDKEMLRHAFDTASKPVIVGKMIKGKHEIFLGIKKDAKIGTVVAFGTGGIFSEIYKDLSFRITPIDKTEAIKMIKETKMGKILDGARGQEKFSLDKLADIIINASRFADSFENISEIDFNPVIASNRGYHIVDTRIISNQVK